LGRFELATKMDWSVVTQVAFTSLITSGIVVFVLRVVFERSLEHIFNRRLKEFEAKLQERTAFRSAFGEQRLEEYRRLSGEILRTRRALNDYLQAPPNRLLSTAGAYNQAVDRFQEALYDNALTLQQDGLYRRMHIYKVRCKTLAEALQAFMRTHGEKDLTEMEALWGSSEEIAKELLNEGIEVTTMLQRTIDMALRGQSSIINQ
jgi:hypothetical protein